jgi:hypothetical protein
MRFINTPKKQEPNSPIYIAGLIICGLGVFFTLLTSTFAGTYYLSHVGNDASGNGSRQNPWKTIRTATDNLPDDGSTIVLLNGTYEGTQSIGRQFSKTCTIRSESPYRAVLQGTTDQNRVLYCYKATHVKIEGLEIRGSGGAQGEYLIHISTPDAHHFVFENCIIHDSYNNDIVKINNASHHVSFRDCLVFNPQDRSGNQLFDINTVTDVELEGCIFMNDYAGSGRQSEHHGQGLVVVKNSGSMPDFTRRITLRRNIFLNYDGAPDQAFLMLGEDGQPFYEAQDVMIENNLFIHNSSIQNWGTLLYKGGIKNITFRANTVTGHPAVKWSGSESALCERINKNPPIGNLAFHNNIWSDPTGRMPRFSTSRQKQFASDAKVMLENNLYWNAGKGIPSDPADVIAPDHDPKKIVANPRFDDLSEEVTLPRWNPQKECFASGRNSIRQEFERLVRRYAALVPGSAALGAADPANMPADDILGNPRKHSPDIGCLESRQ